MFVMNCDVIMDEVLRYEKPKGKSRKKRNKTAGKLIPAVENDGEPRDQSELYHPVKCNECGTEIAVYDSDEVYHFFNILAGQA